MPYVKINGAYFQDTANGLAAVSDAKTLQGLQSGQIQYSTQAAIAGGADRFASAPAGAVPKPGGVAPPGNISGGLNATPSSGVGDLGNLRMALRTALNEAGRNRSVKSYQMLAPLSGGIPGTIGSVVDMIRSGVKSSVESTFSDVMAGYKDATEAKQKELDRINELRLQFGSLVPSSITDLKTALDLVAPQVDKENKLKFDKLRKDLEAAQTEDEDIESWAESYAKGEVAIGNVPAKIRTAVKVRSDEIRKKLEGDAKEEYKSRIAFRLEKKTSDFDTERSLAMQDENLTVAEQRELIDYIDSLEQAQKAAKKAGGGGFFSFLDPSTWNGGGGAAAPVTEPATANVYGQGNFSTISIDDRISQLQKTLGGGAAGANKTYLEQQLMKDGYDSQEITKRTRTGIFDQIFR